MTSDLLEEIEAEYDLCINKPEEYQQKVDRISSLFSLKGKNRLKAEICPVYLFGKYRLTPFVMFGINPGYSQTNSPIEDQEARRSWKHYQDLYINFFLYFSNNRFESPYYTSLWHIVSGLVNSYDHREHQKKDKWKLFDTYLTNIELNPYHSEGIKTMFLESLRNTNRISCTNEIKSCDGEDWLRDRIVNDHASDHLSYLLCYELSSCFFHDSGKSNQPFLLLQNRHFFQLFLSLFISILN
jgi:hypothetical protein